jgi:exonuclease SbcD
VRFLHTADWHLGRTIRGRSRQAEFEAVLGELVTIARDEGIEAMLVCGDIYDTTTPSPDSERLLYETLRELLGLDVQVVLIAGNHDNPRRLEAMGRLAELLGVHVRWRPRPAEGGGIVHLVGREHEARIAAVPWIAEGRLIDAEQLFDLDRDQRIQGYADRAAAIVRAVCDGFEPDTVNILAAHIFVDGARLASLDGSERLLHVGQTYGVNPAALPSTAQYMALGHVHEPQELLTAPAPAAYSGSLLQLDFGERGQQKAVRIIDASPGRPVEQRAVPLAGGRPLVEVSGTFDEVLRGVDGLGEAHLRVILDVDRPEPGMAQRLRDAVPGVVDVRLQYERTEEEPAPAELSKLAPLELFARYYHAQHGAAPAPELLAMFSELLEAEASTIEGLGVAG